MAHYCHIQKVKKKKLLHRETLGAANNTDKCMLSCTSINRYDWNYKKKYSRFFFSFTLGVICEHKPCHSKYSWYSKYTTKSLMQVEAHQLKPCSGCNSSPERRIWRQMKHDSSEAVIITANYPDNRSLLDRGTKNKTGNNCEAKFVGHSNQILHTSVALMP